MSSNGKRSRRKTEDCSVSTGRGSSELITNDVSRFEIGIAERIKGHKEKGHKDKSYKNKSQNGHEDRESNQRIICEEPMAIDLSADGNERVSKVTVSEPIATNEKPIATNEKSIAKNEKPTVTNEKSIVTKEKPTVTNEKPVVPSDGDVTLVEPSASKPPASPGRKRSRKRSPSPVFTLRRDPMEPLKNFADCDTSYDGYVPSVDSGDIIEWMSGRNESVCEVGGCETSSKTGKESVLNPVSGREYRLLEAKCKGCRERFSINNDSSLLKMYLDHCLTQCPEYHSLNLTMYCDPCNLYCIDRLAFISHGRNNTNCPMHDSFNFWSKRWNPGKKPS